MEAQAHPGITIQLDKERTLRFTFNAALRLEESLGGSVDDLPEKLAAQGGSVVLTVLRIGLLHEDPDLTEDMLGDMIDGNNITYVSDKLTEAFKASGFGEQEDESDDAVPGPARRNPTRPRARTKAKTKAGEA